MKNHGYSALHAQLHSHVNAHHKDVQGHGKQRFCFLGLKNFAGLTSSLTGTLIFDAAGIKTLPPCNWDALWWLIVLCNVALPVLGGVPAAWLIPNKLQTEKLYYVLGYISL